MAAPLFRDRTVAGAELASAIGDRSGRPLVVASSLSGVPIAWVVADRLGAELDVLPIGRVRLPACAIPIGAVDEDGHVCITASDLHAVTPSLVAHEVRRAQQEIGRLRQACGLPNLAWRGRDLILVDDGAETGAGLVVAIRKARRSGPARVTVAVPVASARALTSIRPEADDVVVLHMPDPFESIDSAYETRRPVTAADVRQLLAGAHRVDPHAVVQIRS